MLVRSLALGLRNQTVGCLWWGIAHIKNGYIEWERGRPFSFARALFLSNILSRVSNSYDKINYAKRTARRVVGTPAP